MKESEFKALISLLEDDDADVSSHIEGKLIAMGGEMIPKLEHAWEIELDEVIQKRLEDIIQGIQEQETLERFIAWRDADQKDLLEGWFLLSKYVYPNIKYATYSSRINRLVNRIWLELRRDMTVAEKLMVVNAIIFRVEKFRSGGKQMKTPGEFLLNLLFDKRRGGPFSLGILYKIVCEKLEIPLEVVILPDYFVLRSNENGAEFFIDVFQKGDFFVREDLAKFLKELRMDEQEVEILRVVAPEQILLEMINGLMKAFSYQKEPERVEALKELMELLQDA